MVLSIAEATQSARAAFLSTVTIRDTRWARQQLYGLSRILLETEGLVATLTAEDPGAHTAYQHELILALNDIAQHYSNLQQHPKKRHFQAPWGTTTFRSKACGVSLILTDTANPFRFALAPLAASIAAGNAVILATVSKNEFFYLLETQSSKYLDREAIQIVQGVSIESIVPENFDHVLVLANSRERYSSILKQPKANFLDTNPRYSLAVIDEGSKSLNAILAQVAQSFSLRKVVPEAVQALLIHEEDLQPVSQTFKAASAQKPTPEMVAKLTAAGLTFVSDHLYRAELAALIRSKVNPVALRDALCAADEAGVLLLLVYTSLDQILHAIAKLEAPPAQLALFAPANKAHVQYLEKWSSSRVVSIDALHSDIPQTLTSASTLFSPDLFSLPCITVKGTTDRSKCTLSSARQRVQGFVKPVPPEPNQTFEFFGYMRRVFIGAGASLAVACAYGIWRGLKRHV